MAVGEGETVGVGDGVGVGVATGGEAVGVGVGLTDAANQPKSVVQNHPPLPYARPMPMTLYRLLSMLALWPGEPFHAVNALCAVGNAPPAMFSPKAENRSSPNDRMRSTYVLPRESQWDEMPNCAQYAESGQ